MIDPRIEHEILSSPVDLVFISANDPLSWCIRAASNFSSISHAALAVGAHRQWILHAIETGVRLERLDDFLSTSRSTIVGRFRVLPPAQLGLERGLRLVGKPYDLREIFLRALAVVSPMAAQRQLWPVRHDAFTCARYVRCLLGDVTPEWRDLPTWVLPHDLYTHLGPSFQPIC